MPAQRTKLFFSWLLKPFFSDQQYWRVVLLCFVVATTFWLLNALNKNYTNIRTTYPLRFVYDDEKYIPVKPLPEVLDISVSGKGWKLLRKYLILNVRPADIVIQRIPTQNYLTGNALRPNISGVLDGLELNYIFTDTVYFEFDRRVRRKIPLGVDSAKIKTSANTAIVSPIVITPDSVIFDGPAHLVDKMPSPFLITLPDAEIDRSYKRFVPLEYAHKPLVLANAIEAEVNFAVSPIKWQQLAVQPVAKSANSGEPITLPPTLVMVKYGTEKNSRTTFTPEQFEVKALLESFNARDSTVAVKLTRKPVQVKKVVLVPDKIKITH